MGMSSLDTRNPMVIIMEKEFENVRKLLLQYTKLHVQTLIIVNICNVIFCLAMTFNIPLLIVTEIMLNMYLKNSLKTIHKECNLNQVGKIIFGEDATYNIYDINITDVYNSTRELSVMKGKITQFIDNLKYFNKLYIVMASLSVVGEILAIILRTFILKWR